MIISVPLSYKFVRNIMPDLSGNALKLFYLLYWEKKYPRRRVKQVRSIAEKAKYSSAIWIDDYEIAMYLKIDESEVKAVIDELVEKDLVLYDTPAGVTIDRSKIGIYNLRRFR